MRLRDQPTIKRLAWRFGGLRLLLPVRLVQAPARALVLILARMVRRDPRLVVFGGPADRFGDNAAYLFTASGWSEAGLRCVWISGSAEVVNRLRRAGLVAHTRWSRAGVWTAVRAATYVVNAYASDVNGWLFGGATVVNLWHGVPLKRIERDIVSGPLADVYNPKRFGRLVGLAFACERRAPDYVLSPSDFVTRTCFTSAFGVSADRCLDMGYPRNDYLVRGERPTRMLQATDTGPVYDDLITVPFVVGYFPTWRESGTNVLDGEELSVEVLAACVERLGGVVVYKPHYNMVGDVGGGSAIRLRPEQDVHAILGVCSVLITDYSSLAFDFMLLRRPILYFVPDLLAYAEERGLYFSPDEAMPGPLCRDVRTLLAEIEATASQLKSPSGPPSYDLVGTSERFWGENTGDSAARLVGFLRRQAGDPADFRPAIA